ncbi:hypothetical protein ACFLVE_02905 [Chloroflexota bacterium]
MIEVSVVIKDRLHQYYLLKVERRELDVYCFIPDLGLHHSFHRSGESHFRHEGKGAKPGEEPPVALIMGEAGTPIKNGIICTSLCGLGRAVGICTAIFSITSLDQDFRKFKRNLTECFVIDTALLPEDAKVVEVGVWAVPIRNKVSFEFNNPSIPADLLYKVGQCEPQIWIYARSF